MRAKVTKLKRSRRRGETTHGTEEEKPVIEMSASSAERHNGWPPDRQSRKKGPKLKILFKSYPGQFKLHGAH
tara:strand:- start:612 stop:827 length:216 start_codon:yes stop_codon:yes gene_type:complete